jgi:anti-anti-sigma factor
VDSLFETDGISIDRDLLERTNPVFNTARMTLQLLTSTGHKDAGELSGKLGYNYDNTVGWFADDKSEEERAGAKEGLISAAMCVETRYKTMTELAVASGYPTVIDLPCGYTPHAIEYARRKLHFLGLDLPVVISEAEPAILSLVGDKDLVDFASVDATNYDSLKKALSDVEGPVCITTEGLLMYFTDSELGQICTNIREILKSHGGCWITADPEGSYQTIQTLQAVCGERFQEVLKASTGKVQNKEDTLMTRNSIVIDPFIPPEQGIGSAMDFISRFGLKVERMIILDHMPEVASISGLNAEQVGRLKEILGKFAYWKITPDDNRAGQTNGSIQVETGTEIFDASFEGSTLVLKLKNRIDTLNSPLLLAFYEKISKEHIIDRISVDCSELEYISSAGLRVLMIMYKGSRNGLTLYNTNSAVSEILDETGFSEIFTVSRNG